MTTHVFVVDKTTIAQHLKYMFVGTGSSENSVSFIFDSCQEPNTRSKAEESSDFSNITVGREKKLLAMMADGCRLRKGDYIIFYLQQSSGIEGGFYGLFKAEMDGIYIADDANYYMHEKLGKPLLFRSLISPVEVYAKGVTEWEALDEIKSITAPYGMQWSLIYRKLKGNRGNTMITLYESEKLIYLIQKKNNFNQLKGKNFTYNENNGLIETTSISTGIKEAGRSFDVFNRLYYKRNLSFEAHLQLYIMQCLIGKTKNLSLLRSLGINSLEDIEWIGNEVSCGVGMQRIDILLSVKRNKDNVLMPIELKSVAAEKNNSKQIYRYIEWLEQYYIPNKPSIIQPVLICYQKNRKADLKEMFNDFNIAGENRYKPLNFISFKIEDTGIIFNQEVY